MQLRGRVLVAGATSDAGKSVVTTGLCRALARRGARVAPFKAQNMSNNSMVTADGAEIGRAQWIQAVAARAEPEAAMNPVLLKPGSELVSHLVVMGRPAGRLAANEFASGREQLRQAAFAAFDDLASRYDVVVCEGAGGAAEINLRDRDFVNLGLARHAAMPTILVGDIGRGGVFAALFGSLALLDADDQRLVAGFVVNKFRGDESLLRPGLDRLAELTGRPVFGVLPWLLGLWLDSEDSLAVPGRPDRPEADQLRVVVVRFPRISNFTDLDALGLEPQVQLTFTHSARALAAADLIVLPGTRATRADLEWLRASGLADAVQRHAARGGAVLGLCGGFQMLGRRIEDPDGVEDAPGTVPGLDLLDAVTVFGTEKVVRLSTGAGLGAPVNGYEIHHGQVDAASGDPFPGGVRRGAVFGTMWHGCFEGDAFREAFLRDVANRSGSRYTPGGIRFESARQQRIDRLADLLERRLDLDAICDLIAGRVTVRRPTVTIGLC